MALNFWGGFASGMSETIEKNKDRAQKRKQIKAAQDAAAADTESKIQDMRLKSEKLMSDLSDRKNKILSGDTDMGKDQAVKAVNAITKQMHSVIVGMSKYAANIGKSPSEIVDPTMYDLDTYSIKNGNVWVNKTMEYELENSNGELRMNGNKVQKKAKVQNSSGQPVDVVDEKGEPVYEDTGNANKIFAPKITQKTPTQLMTEGEYEGAYVYTDKEGSPILRNGKPVVAKVESKGKFMSKEQEKKMSVLKMAKGDAWLGQVDELNQILSNQSKEGWFFSGISGAAASLPFLDTDRNKAEDHMEPIRAGIAFDTLGQMRETSPTGGALGSISKPELDFLQNSMGTIDLNQNPEWNQKQLMTIKNNYLSIVHGLRYDEKSKEYVQMSRDEYSDWKENQGIGSTDNDAYEREKEQLMNNPKFKNVPESKIEEYLNKKHKR